MWLYWLMFVSFALMVFVGRNFKSLQLNSHTLKLEYRITYFGVAILFVCLMIGLRYQVGGDWDAYLNKMYETSGEDWLESISRGDPGYQFLNWIGANVGGGIYFVNTVCSILFVWGLSKFCIAQPRPWLALLVALPYFIIVVAMGYTRQSAAIGICMIGLTLLQDGKTFRFLLLLAVATLFHKSAVVLFPFAIFSRQSNKLVTILGVFIIGALVAFLLVLDSLENLSYGYLESGYSSSGALIRVVMNAFPALFFLIFLSKFQLPPDQRKFWLWMALAALLFVILLWISPSSTAVDRLALYWIPIQLVVWSRLPNALNFFGGKTIWLSLVVIYCAVVQFVWLFYADNSSYWVPYQFYPWVWVWS